MGQKEGLNTEVNGGDVPFDQLGEGGLRTGGVALKQFRVGYHVHSVTFIVSQVEGVDYVDTIDVCRNLGLRFELSANGKAITLERGSRRGTLSDKSREMLLDGVRIYLGDAAEARGGRIFVSRIDYERRLLPLWRPDLVDLLPRWPRVIVLDPGHGGWDPGAENNSLTLPLRAGGTGGLGLQALAMTSRSRRFDAQLFCHAHGLKQGEFARMTGSSAARADRGRSKAHRAEVIRLIMALGSLMAPERLGLWIRRPNKGFRGLMPLEVIEQGKTDRLWRMIYEIRSGQPD